MGVFPVLIILVFPAGEVKNIFKRLEAIQNAGFAQKELVYCFAFTGNDTPPLIPNHMKAT